MSAGLKSIVVKFVGDVTSLTQASDKAGKDLGSVATKGEDAGSRLGKVFKFAAVAAGIGIAVEGVKSLGESLYGLAEQAADSQRASNATAQVIKSTGNAAHVTAAQIDKLTTAQSNKNGVDDDAVRAGDNMLLTFTNIKNAAGKNNDIFNQASQTVLDLTAAMNQGKVTNESASKTAIQLGKALNDPVKGVTALTKVGVTFDDQQKKQIKTMVKAGDVAGAQKIVLKELNKEFGGQAAAQSSAADKASVAWGNFQKQIGAYVLPLFTALANYLSQKLIPALSDLADWANTKVVPALRQLATWVQVHVIPVVRQLADYVEANVVPALRKAWTMVQQNVVPAVLRLATYVEANVIPALRKVWTVIQQNVIPAVQTVAKFVVSQLVPAVVAVYQKLSASLVPVLRELWNQLEKNVIPSLKRVWVTFSTQLWPIIKVVIDVLGTLVAFIVSKLGPVLLKLVGGVFPVVAAAFDKLVLGIQVLIATTKLIAGAFVKAWDAVKGVFADPLGFFENVGKQLIEGLKNGITGALGGLWDTVKSIPGKALGFLKSGFGIFSPSKKTAQTGLQLMQGLQVGIQNGYPLVATALQSTIDKMSTTFAAGTKSIVTKGESALASLDAKLNAPVKGIVDKVKAATDALASLQDASAGLKSSVADSFTGLADASTFGGTDISATLSAAVARGADFSAQIKKLQSLGLNSTAIGQLLAAGPGAADAAANQLSAGGQGLVDEVNKQYATLAAQGADLGVSAAKSMYGAGIQAAQGLVKGLQSQQAAIEKQMATISAGMVKAIKKALGISSPSRVFADQVGQHIPTGLAMGIRENAGAAHAAVGDLGAALPGSLRLSGAGGPGSHSSSTVTQVMSGGTDITQFVTSIVMQNTRGTRNAVRAGASRAFT